MLAEEIQREAAKAEPREKLKVRSVFAGVINSLTSMKRASLAITSAMEMKEAKGYHKRELHEIQKKVGNLKGQIMAVLDELNRSDVLSK